MVGKEAQTVTATMVDHNKAKVILVSHQQRKVYFQMLELVAQQRKGDIQMLERIHRIMLATHPMAVIHRISPVILAENLLQAINWVHLTALGQAIAKAIIQMPSHQLKEITQMRSELQVGMTFQVLYLHKIKMEKDIQEVAHLRKIKMDTIQIEMIIAMVIRPLLELVKQVLILSLIVKVFLMDNSRHRQLRMITQMVIQAVFHKYHSEEILMHLRTTQTVEN